MDHDEIIKKYNFNSFMHFLFDPAADTTSITSADSVEHDIKGTPIQGSRSQAAGGTTVSASAPVSVHQDTQSTAGVDPVISTPSRCQDHNAGI